MRKNNTTKLIVFVMALGGLLQFRERIVFRCHLQTTTCSKNKKNIEEQLRGRFYRTYLDPCVISQYGIGMI